ncbi:unnamed protein product, partial [marine sediment metagenome]
SSSVTDVTDEYEFLAEPQEFEHVVALTVGIITDA